MVDVIQLCNYENILFFSFHYAFFLHRQEAIAEEQRMKARYTNDTDIAKSERDFSVKKAEYDMEVNAKV